MTGIVQTLIGGFGAVAAAVTDAYFNLVTLLLPGNGTNGAQNNTFLDSSTNNFTITRNGNTTQGTFSPFSQTGWSNYFNGSSSLQFPSNAALAPGTGDFTIEFWYYRISDGPIFVTAISGGLYVGGLPGPEFGLRAYAVANICSTTTLPTANQWTHIAITRSGTTCRLFYNGVLQQTSTSSQNFVQGNSYLGTDAGGAFSTQYISNFRLVKGTAVYTAAFTPPTAPLTAITNTSLLTCQDNRFIDNSSNAFAITVNSSPSVQAFSPFAPTASYSASTNGGSGYFDGSGDYLTIARNTAFIPTTGDFTFEAWIYPTVLANTIIAALQETGTAADWAFFIASDSTIGLFAGNGSGQLNSTQTVKANQWNHCVASRSGNTLYIGCNGALTSGTFTNSLDNGQSYPLSIGADQNGDENNLTGYMSGLRLIKGSAQYTSTTYTVPTAPPTAITNTAVLLNYTNAGITDATAKNDLETVGNAQISTAQSKFGGSSMYFDGTGDYLRFLSTVDTRFGTGDFTIEMWVRNSAISNTTALIERRSALAGRGLYMYFETSKIRMISGDGTGAAQVVIESGTLSSNTWYHIALTRSGSSWRGFVDGTQIGTTVTWSGTPADETSPWLVGVFYDGSGGFNGYIDDLRMTKGYARYTANFTPPTAAFPVQ